MTFGEELRDQLPAISQFTAGGIELIAEIRDFFKERSALDKEYAHKLEQLSKKFLKQKDKLGHAMMGGDSSAQSSGEEKETLAKYGTCLKAWEDMLKETDEIARFKLELSEKIISEVTDPMKAFNLKLDESRKKHLSFSQRLIDERNKAYADNDKAKQKYDESCDSIEASKNRHDRAADDKSREKLKKAWNQEVVEMNNLKNNYILSVAVANAIKKQHYYVEMPTLMDQMQDLNEYRSEGLKKFCTDYVGLEIRALEMSRKSFETMLTTIHNIDGKFDTNLFAKLSWKEWSEPTDFKFTPTLLWKDGDELITDESAKIYLTNMVAKLSEKMTDLDKELDEKRKEIDGLRNLFDAYTANPATGNPFDVKENIIEAQRSLALLDASKLRCDTSLAVIRQAIGDGDAGTRHTLAKCTFAIPTSCDFCMDKIWVTQQGFTCKPCGYNCHAKCELKVPPNCSNEKGKKTKSGPNPQSIPASIKSQDNSTSSSTIPKNSSQDQNGRRSTATLSSSSTTATKQRTTAKVLYAYDAINKDELSIDVGQILQILSADDGSGWVQASHDSKKGLVPVTYIEMSDDSSADSSENPGSNKVRVIYDYDAQKSDELSITTGQEIHVLSKGDDGWWMGSFNGKKGLFPSTYVEEL